MRKSGGRWRRTVYIIYCKLYLCGDASTSRAIRPAYAAIVVDDEGEGSICYQYRLERVLRLQRG